MSNPQTALCKQPLRRPTVLTTGVKPTELELVTYLEQQFANIEVTNGLWHIYNPLTGCWDDFEKDDFRPIVLGIIPAAHRQVKLSRQVLEHAEDKWRVKTRFYSAIQPFDNRLDTVLINVLNGVLKISRSTIELLPHDSSYRFTRALRVAYDPTSANNLMSDAINHTFPDPSDQHLFQLLCANILIPDCRFEVSAVIYGEAGTGKDTVMAPIVSLFGPSEYGLSTNISLDLICDPKSYCLPYLQHACFNLCTELNSIHVKDSSIFKRLVSGDKIQARHIYGRPFDMLPFCKLFALSNNMPKFRDGTAAEVRRIRFLRCERQPTTVDVTFKERLRIPHPGTLNWLLTGLQSILTLDTKAMPHGGTISAEAHTRFNTTNDPIGNFISRYCRMDRDLSVSKDTLVDAFNAFATENNIDNYITNNFLRSLYNRFPSISAFRCRVKGGRERGIKGLELTPAGLELLTLQNDPKNLLDLS